MSEQPVGFIPLPVHTFVCFNGPPILSRLAVLFVWNIGIHCAPVGLMHGLLCCKSANVSQQSLSKKDCQMAKFQINNLTRQMVTTSNASLLYC